MKNKQLYTPPYGLPPPAAFAITHANALVDHIIQVINQQNGKISFAQFMELSLYTPGLGYYAAGSRKIGAEGDFMTAPEISPLFSYCLAKQCAEIFDQLGGGNLLEFGAGSGKMAVDILTYLADHHALPEYYFILETSAELKQRQQATFEQHAPHFLSHIQWLTTLPSNFNGIMLANEVIDALPVHRFLVNSQQDIQEYYVGWNNDEFIWLTDKPSCSEFTTAVEKIQQDYLTDRVTPYTSEINLYASAWLRSLNESLNRGAILLIDYGFSGDVYYHPERSEGTLMCHYRHRAHPNPLILIGLQDITAHVDFSFIAESAVKMGLTVAGYTTQADFLLNCGLLDWVQSEKNLVNRLEISRQIQTLTMPHEMGELFKVLLLSKGLEGEDFSGF